MNKEQVYPSANDIYLSQLLLDARNQERKDKALAVSIRLEALAITICRKELNHKEVAELLRQEALRFEHESQELH
ncbi:DUF2732 domain-containing protein [Erwinia psidii]|uniref:DUF2732 family protein n=1 Tax=Erwinia psidii TaxID=69224 RepID=UPI00226B2851|nr:DUF2732 family protein [Erwinia psidii]MCX8962730.1 DUF2732 domain-containing protein [Erwinia psidii]